MNVAVFSDTHTNTGRMVKAVRQYRPDVIIHLGDHDRDVVQLGPVKAFITHGHLYNVRYGRLDSLAYAAQEAGAQLALFGHTHQAAYEEMGGVKIVNPGTAGVGYKLTWAWIQIFDNGGIACEIRNL